MGGRKIQKSLKTVLSKMRHVGQWLALLSAFALLFFLIPWYHTIVPQQLELPDGFSYKADVISYDNFYDDKLNQYSGEVQSVTKFLYEATGHSGDTLTIKNSFDVRTSTGEPIFDVTRLYGVDAETGKHVPSAGDRARTGYLFAPRDLHKQDFIYWHVNYDTPATMKFAAEEKLLGLNTYHYTANYHADQTANLGNLPGVGKTRGVELDIKLDMWFEPLTGYLVTYEDHTTAYYYDLKTHERLVPWNQFHNRYSFDSLAAHVAVAEGLRQKAVTLQTIIPGVICTVAISLLASVLWRRLRWLRIKHGVLERSMAAVVAAIGAVSFVFWLFGGSIHALPAILTPAYPGASVGLFIIGVSVLLLGSERIGRLWRRGIVLLLVVTGLLAAGVWAGFASAAANSDALDLGGGPVPVISVMAAVGISLMALCTLFRFFLTQSFLARVCAEICASFAFLLGMACITIYAYGDNVGWFALLHEVKIPASAGIVLLSLAAIYGERKWYANRAIGRLGKGGVLFVLVLFGSLLLTGVAWRVVSNDAQKQEELQFEADVSTIQDRIVAELDAYAGALRGGRSLFAASQSVERNEWKAYVDGLRLGQDYPGMQGLGFAQVIPRSQLQTVTNAIHKEGLSDFAVHPLDPPRDIYTAIIFLEPFDERNQRAFGFDMTSETVRRSAMERARDVGDIAMSGTVTLIQETATDRQAGFLVYMPVYKKGVPLTTVDERDAAISGYVYAPFRMNNFMRAAIGEQTKGIAVEVFDAGSGKASFSDKIQMYASDDDIDRASPLAVVKRFSFGGHTWDIRYTAPAVYTNGGVITVPHAVLAAGLALSMVLATIVYLLASSRQRAVNYGVQLTKDLQRQRDAAVRVERKDESILGSITEGLMLFDHQGRIERMNLAAQRMLGYSEAEGRGVLLSDLVVTLDREGKKVPATHLPFAKVAKTNDPIVEASLQYVRKGGSPFPIALSMAPVMEGGTVIGYIEIFRDVTAERNLEKAKDEFLSIASHQLRTPIAAERWYLDILTDGTVGKLSAAQRDIALKIAASNVRLADLVGSLLNVSRAESGRLTLKPQPTVINEMVASVVDEVRAQIEERGQSVHVEADRRYKLLIDPTLVRQVFINLLTNASKYSPEKTTVYITLKEKGAYLVCDVRDEGYGIPRNQYDRVFSKFFRATNILQKQTEGNGLGLYLVKTVVELSGGTITFESKEGAGTTFTFTLPLKGSHPHKGEVTLGPQSS